MDTEAAGLQEHPVAPATADPFLLAESDEAKAQRAAAGVWGSLWAQVERLRAELQRERRRGEEQCDSSGGEPLAWPAEKEQVGDPLPEAAAAQLHPDVPTQPAAGAGAAVAQPRAGDLGNRGPGPGGAGSPLLPAGDHRHQNLGLWHPALWGALLNAGGSLRSTEGPEV